MPNCLYYSNNHGQYGSWVFRTAEGADEIESGRNEGEIFKGPGMSSNDYGYSFTQHSLNGCFCSIKTFEIGNQDFIGYILGDVYGILDSLWLLISYDNFENLEIKHIFNWISCNSYSLSRGTEPGELYLLRSAFTGDGSRITELWYSSNFGENWIFKNHLLSNYIVGGRQQGELFVLAVYMQLMGEIKHTFIYHSLDYGETFTVYHPFSYGPSPYYANFEAEPISGEVPLTVQFTDLSSGDDIQNWEWDFQNDGIVDSYEQNPTFTYQDTGYYSVKLKIQYGPIEDGFIKANYIHVTDDQGCAEHNIQNPSAIKLTNYPNPFKQETVISCKLPPNLKNTILEIYNVKGQLIKQFKRQKVKGKNIEIVWDGRDNNGKPVANGIYLYKLSIDKSEDISSERKSIIKKMILLK
ncbi:MAG: T9SS type A sorting domain-containing protein [Candidatus Cloacimonetes bacterium]|nr:T9SS type A sorting domain-containing protein [Candidatus Cloacimonadota bacterium]